MVCVSLNLFEHAAHWMECARRAALEHVKLYLSIYNAKVQRAHHINFRAATAGLVTVVGVYFALSPTDGAEHAHDTHHEGQGKDFGAEHADEAHDPEEHVKEDDARATEEANEGTDAESEDKSDDESKEKSDDEELKKSESKEDDKSGEEEKPSKDEGDESKEDSKSSGESKKGEDGKEQDDTNASEDQGTKDDSQKGNLPPGYKTAKEMVHHDGPDDIAKLHKGMTKQQGDIKHREEDSGKGATKVRLDSPAGKTVGGENSPSSGDGDGQTKTQRGVSNTDTKHSTDPHADPTKSSKGEGTAETAKIKGTVQPDRKQV